jgi:hypothetical protein
VIVISAIAIVLTLLVVDGITRSRTETTGSSAPSSSPLATLPPPSGRLVFDDKFIDRASGWAQAGQVALGGRYSSGATYRIRAQPGYTWWSSPRNATAVYPTADPRIRIDLEARAVVGANQSTYGAVCYANSENYYAFFVDENGRVTVEKSRGSQHDQLTSTNTSVVRNTATKRIQAICTGTTGGKSVDLSLWINGYLLATATDKDHPLPPGTVGLIAVAYAGADKPIEAEFYSFDVMKV